MKRTLLIITALALFVLPCIAHPPTSAWSPEFTAWLAPCTDYNCGDDGACQTYSAVPYCSGVCSGGRHCLITTGVCAFGFPPKGCWIARCVNASECPEHGDKFPAPRSAAMYR